MRSWSTPPGLFALLLLSALLGLCGFLALASARSESLTATGSGGSQNINMSAGERANRLVARHDAQALLAKLALPLGARPTQGAPHGSGSELADSSLAIPSPDVVDRHAFWIVPAPVPEVLAFIEAHRPAASRLESSGSGGQDGLTTSWFVRFAWTPVPSVLYVRSLSVTLVVLPGGSTAIRADAGDMWDIPRPASERIPSRASVLDVSVARPGARPSPSLTVTDRAKVRKIARAIDRLPTVQPLAIACPDIEFDAPTVTFTFRASARGPALARASEPTSASGPLAPCEPMRFTLEGQALAPLLGGATVVEQAQALLGVTLRQAR